MRESSMTPIAVVGMACRLPGGIDSPRKLWEALLRGEDLVTEIPRDRWDAEENFDPEPGVAGRSVSKWGAFLDDVTGFDPDFFGINEREATAMDPQHRVLLETAWEAVEHAGRTPSSMAGTSTGVFIGMSHDDYAMVTSDAGAFDQAYAFTGNPFSMASGRISHALGLHGPALTMDTACSSSMVAVHQACRSLHEGESDMALAGGVMLMLDQRLYASASGQGMLSATGRCHAFDVEADGFVRAEGCGIVMLKRLDDAQRDGDRVLAVIRGTASNQDGRTENILTPSEDAQVAVFRAALANAGVDPATVGMVEGHGTGTPVGDTIEFNSVSTVYGHDGRCALTSVKSNFGHAESAAGVLGLMKAVLSVHNGVVPRNLHFNRLPDHLARIETGLFVPQETTAWPVDESVAPRRAGVSSYGMSGTNVHVVLEQAPEPSMSDFVADSVETAPAGGELVFPVSSTSAGELRRTARNWSARFPRRRPGNCGAPRAVWPSGSRIRAPSRIWEIWPSLCPGGAATGRRGRRSSPPTGPLWSRVCGQSPTVTSRTRPPSDRTTAARCGCSPVRVRSGPPWARNCSPASPFSRRRSQNSSP